MRYSQVPKSIDDTQMSSNTCIKLRPIDTTLYENCSYGNKWGVSIELPIENK